MQDNQAKQAYIDSLTQENDIFSGNTILLPERLGKIYGRLKGIEEDYDVAKRSGMMPANYLAEIKQFHDRVLSQYTKAMKEEFPEFFASENIKRDTMKKTETSETQKPNNDMSRNERKAEDIVALNERYLQSLKDPDDVLSGNRNLLKGELRKLYRNAIAEEKKVGKLLDSGTTSGSVLSQAQDCFTKTHNAFMDAMTDLDNIRKRQQTAKAVKPDKDTTEAKKEQRPPQLVTVNGDKITHGHIFQHEKTEEWMFSYRINGKNMPVIRLSAEDAAKFQNTVADKGTPAAVQAVLEKYNPSKLQPKVPTEEWTKANILSDGRVLDKFTVFKESDPARADYGKWKFYAQVGDAKMSRVADFESRNAFFDRTQTPAQIAERLFGEKLNLASAYAKYTLPEGVDNIRIGKGNDQKWQISAEVDGIRTPKRELSYDDRTSYFKTKTATSDQLAAKYLMNDINEMRTQSAKAERGMKM